MPIITFTKAETKSAKAVYEAYCKVRGGGRSFEKQLEADSSADMKAYYKGEDMIIELRSDTYIAANYFIASRMSSIVAVIDNFVTAAKVLKSLVKEIAPDMKTLVKDFESFAFEQNKHSFIENMSVLSKDEVEQVINTLNSEIGAYEAELEDIGTDFENMSKKDFDLFKNLKKKIKNKKIMAGEAFDVFSSK